MRKNYRFGRFYTLLRHPAAEANTAGARIPPEGKAVWWWPVNWLVVPLALLVIAPTVLVRRATRSMNETRSVEEERP